jgi:hypothetical protein
VKQGGARSTYPPRPALYRCSTAYRQVASMS